jgi:L,D-transpeptidase ErfK/SrfK
MIRSIRGGLAAWAALTASVGLSATEFMISEGTDVIGEVQVIRAEYEDTFVKLARRYNVGYEELRRANPNVDAWLPGAGTEIVLPTQFVLPRAERRGIVINLPELRLYYFPDDDGRRVITHPISIGRMDWATPLGRTSVVSKAKNPSWYPPQSIRDEHAARNDPLPNVVPPGPDNPLGNHALRLGIPGYLIHGTNKPSGVGMRVTHGCIRMFPEDIESLFEMVGSGTQVRIVDQPFKLGWGNGGLYLEAHLPLQEPDEVIDLDEPSEELDVDRVPAEGQWTATELTRLYVAATQSRTARVDWLSAERVMDEALGVPEFVAVAEESPAVAEEVQSVADANSSEPSLVAETSLLD